MLFELFCVFWELTKQEVHSDAFIQGGESLSVI